MPKISPLLLALFLASLALPAARAQQAPPATTTMPQASKPADGSAADKQGEGEITIDEIPNIKVMELTPEIAKHAIDGFALQHEKYQDAPISDYDTPEEFVAKDPKGKQFEADLKALGFANVADWDVAVLSITVAYNNILDDQSGDIKEQIEEIKTRSDLTQAQKDEATRRLGTQIPSANNSKIISDLLKDKAYAAKIKLFESSEE